MNEAMIGDVVSELDARLARAERALTRSGWAYTEGAEEWKSPVNHKFREMYLRAVDAEDNLAGARARVNELLAVSDALERQLEEWRQRALAWKGERDATIAHLLDALEQATLQDWGDYVPPEVVAQCEAALLLRETFVKGE